MQDLYRVPSLVLTLLLLPAFAYLYHRYRNTRTLLWLLGFLFSLLRMGQLLLIDVLGGNSRQHMWLQLAGVISAQISSTLFLASLSPKRVYLGRVRLLYLYVVCTAGSTLLVEFRFMELGPEWMLQWGFPLLAFIAALASIRWGWKSGAVPGWLGAGTCIVAALIVALAYLHSGAVVCLYTADTCIRLVTALMVIAVFRRFTPGVFLTVTGFVVWSATMARHLPGIELSVLGEIYWTRAVTMGKVVAAMGMILLTLEDELIAKKAAQERERAMRLEMEAYTQLAYSHPKVTEFDGRATEICQAISMLSRFRQVALLLLDGFGRYQLAGACGLAPEEQSVLGEAVARAAAKDFLLAGTALPSVEGSATVKLDLRPWLKADDLLVMRQASEFYAIPLKGRASTHGVLLLSGLRGEALPAAEDLLPLELFASRLESARSKTIMLEKLIRNEKFASVGQLAESVTHQLNNPLTVILGYASLLEGSAEDDSDESEYVAAILEQARRMKTMVESLTRVSSANWERWAAVSVAELLTDLEQLHREEFERSEIDFTISVSPDLPRAWCHAQQLRMAIQHCLQYGIEALHAGEAGGEKQLRLEARQEGGQVRIELRHSGQSFADPESAFDPLAEVRNLAESRTLGLSLCSSILQDNHGRVQARNLEPRGAAIVLELEVA